MSNPRPPQRDSATKIESEAKSESGSAKFQALQQYLHGEGGSSSSDAERYLSSSRIAARLFSKARPEFLERKSINDLAHITKRSAEAAEAILSGKQGTFISSELNEGFCSIYLATGDRPFIINSVTECLSELHIPLRTYLHPILLHNGFRLSLSYLEIDSVTPDRLELLERRLSRSLEDLRLVTDDFTSMLVRIETLARVLGNPKYSSMFPQSEQREISDFLQWLTDGGFIFLGYAEWRFGKDGAEPAQPTSCLGLCRPSSSIESALSTEAREDALEIRESDEPIVVAKLRTESTVHRRIRINNITIIEFSTDGGHVTAHSIIGLFTSKALSQESSSVPLIRRKIKQLTEIEEIFENSFDYKNVINIIDSIPKDEVLKIDVEGLREIVNTIISVQNERETRLTLRYDPLKRGVSVLIVMPRDRFNTAIRDRLQRHLEERFGATPGSSEYHLDLSPRPDARLYFYIPAAYGEVSVVDLNDLRATVSELSQSWIDNVRSELSQDPEVKSVEAIWNTYAEAFSDDYQAATPVSEACTDVKMLEKLSWQHPTAVVMIPAAHAAEARSVLVIYQYGAEIILSKALPVLENAGFNVINERSFQVKPLGKDAIYIQRFVVESKHGAALDPKHFEATLAPGLVQVFRGEAENDLLNSLMTQVGISTRPIALLRTYCHLLWQVRRFATRQSIFECLASLPSHALVFWKMFELRFDPNLNMEIGRRRAEFEKHLQGFRTSLHGVKDITHDRILRSLAALLEHTVRTNFYNNTPNIVLKLASSHIEIMPPPRPLFEIFVRSPMMEGVHLRSGMVARGGIRWSDRVEDFRTEVLGLMKTQRIKNAVIVPEGAKGGFVIPKLPAAPDQISHLVQQAYKEFIRSLLSVSDNRVNGEIVHPTGAIAYDEPDPYLVVAADKGTATFSDLANKIAVEEYQFWLSDAFASGGSNGYDHKLYGITARGAWECAKRHFKDLGIRFQDEPFTVVGIGDMSGDVFGNGLLLSRQMKLIGAFNHKHVFVDPNPDPEASFRERERLFKLPRSQWIDYSRSALSNGGAIYERFDKDIKLSPEARAALSIPDLAPHSMSGEEVIQCILRAKVDLLWNGGIGTYVKSSEESDAEVNDGTNDRVRVNARDMQTRIVVEGGNLGLTQRARIELAACGRRVNTDAVDNSGGVDLSDHEVNLKILFAQLIKNKRITLAERDDLLKNLVTDVTADVLQHNRRQALLLTLAESRSSKNIEYFASMIRELHRMGYVNRSLEHLPDDDELADRVKKGQGLTRPELAVCMASVKMQVRDNILDSDLLKDPLVKETLLLYFPKALQKSFRDEIFEHPLADEITATQITNYLVDHLGITYVHRMSLSHSVSTKSVITSAFAANFIIGAEKLYNSLESFDTTELNHEYLELLQSVSRSLIDATAWLMSSHGSDTSLAEIVKLYQPSYLTLVTNVDQILSGDARATFIRRYERYIALGLPSTVARNVATLREIVFVLEMLWTSRKTRRNIETVARLFSAVMQELGIFSLIRDESNIKTTDKWEAELLAATIDDIRRSVSLITEKLLKSGIVVEQHVGKALRESPSFEQLHTVMDEISRTNHSAAGLAVIARQIRTYQLPSVKTP